MKAQGPVMLPVGVFALCAAAGWLAGRPGNAGNNAASAIAAMPAKTGRAPAKGGVPSEVTAMLAPIRAARNTEERLRATIQLADNIPLSDIEKWLSSSWFKGAEDMQASLFQRTLLSRWQEADPGGMLEYCIRREIRITYEFSRDWAARDPVAALALIESQTKPQMRSAMLGQMGDALAKANPQLALSRIEDLAAAAGSDNPHQIDGVIKALAESSPALLEAQLAGFPKQLRDMARNHLAGAALGKDFSRGVAELASQEDGMRVFAEAAGSNQELMKKVSSDPGSLPPGWLGAVTANSGSYYLVQDNPAKWLEMDLAGLGLDENQARQIRSSALSQMGSKDPEKLKELIAGQQLSANEFGSAIYGLVGHMKQDAAEKWIAGLTNEDHLRVAKEAFASRAHSDGTETTTPASLLGDLAGDGREISSTEARSLGKWDREQMQALNEEFDALPPDKKAAVAGKFITRSHYEIPVEIQAKALDYLLENPDSPQEVQNPQSQGRDLLASSACALAARWAEQDPAAAASWVKDLPSGTARLWAAKNLAARWAEYEPAAAQRWAGSLSAGDRAEVEAFMKSRRPGGP